MQKGLATGFVGLTAALTVAFLFRPNTQGPTPCFVKNVAGVACPGCGMTRSIAAAARGEFGAAFRWHAFGPIVLAAGLVTWALLAAGLVTGRNRLPDLNSRVWTVGLVAFLVLLILYWLVRLATHTTP